MDIGQIILLVCGIVIGFNLLFVAIEWIDRNLPDWTPLAAFGVIVLAGIVLTILGI